MKKNNDETLLHAAMMGETNSLAPSSVQEQLAQLLLEKYQKDLGDEQTKKDIRRRQQEILAKEAKQKREEELRVQKACLHRKPNGTSALVASYNHQGVLMGFCQNCGKEWINNDTPPDLMPDSEAIGGPGVR